MYGNRLQSLPPELAKLTLLKRVTNTGTEGLVIGSNPLPDDFFEVAEQGIDALFAYLRELETDSAPIYEAKLLVTGEGRLGKTCLVRALRNEDPDDYQEQETTYGVELGDALYLLVWKPDLGLEQCRVRGWLTQIRLVAGPTAKVILVATHASHNRGRYSPRINLGEFPDELAEIVVDQIEVDSIELEHIDELKGLIARHAAALDHMGEPFPNKFRNARERVLQTTDPYISYRGFAKDCEKEGLDAIKTYTQASVFISKLGKGIYYGDRLEGGAAGEDDDGPIRFQDDLLADTVVLDAEWVSKALVMVFEDPATQAANGLLWHTRLGEIWHDHDRDDEWPRYSAQERYFLLRLLQRMHVSYVPSEAGETSILAQLVPDPRPPGLPWSDAPQEQETELRSVCVMKHDPTGLIPWLIVSLAPYQVPQEGSEGLGFAWQKGMLIESPQLGARALVEYERNEAKHLEIAVRGAAPQVFFGVIYGAIEVIFERNFRNLEWEFQVPCPGDSAAGGRCRGSFAVGRLLRRLAKDKTMDECRECDGEFPLPDLLVGFEGLRPSGDEALQQELRSLGRKVDEQHELLARLEFHQFAPCPRLFSLEQVKVAKAVAKAKRIVKHSFELTLYCEYSGRPLPPYRFEVTPEWLRKLKPIARIGSLLLAGMQVPLGEEAAAQVKELDKVVSQATGLIRDDTVGSDLGDKADQPQLATDAQYRLLHQLMMDIKLAPGFQGMSPRQLPDGRWLWVDPESARELDRHEPKIPGQVRPTTLVPEDASS